MTARAKQRQEVPVDPRGGIALQPGGLVVYDNARGAKGKIQFVSDEIGDEFTLDDSQRVINEIQFEYFAALNPFESTQKGVLRFYANNGPAVADGGAKKPGDLLFESDAFSLRAGYNMVTVSDLRVRVPEDVTSVTWAVEFTGVTNIGKVGLLQHDEPAKGASANTFWLNTGTKAAPNWQLQKPADGHGNFSARIAARTPPPVSLAVGSEVYAMGEPVKVTFAEGPGNPKDWIGIYRPDMIPGSAAAPAWAYVNGYKTAGKGRTGGTLVFDDVLPAGNYVARFFENDDFDQLASATFSIAEPPGVAVGSEAYLPDEPITFHFARGPGNPKDWIAVYRPDMIPSKVPSLLWAFVNGTQTAGEGLASGSVTFASGLPAGEYVARYLENDDYNQLAEVSFNVTDNTAPVITLKGQQSVTINVGEAYEDAGATARDNVDGNITKSITITGVVDPSRPAVYTLIYTVKDNSGNAAAIMARTVRVLDAVAPVLTLKGEQSVTINAVENYKDAGASARDNVDGDISKSIKTTGTVNANKPGVYTIIYSVKDKSGNAAVSVVRTVTVVDAVSPVITLKGEQTVTINVGEAYEDAGATARDNVDGNITKSITITGVVDPSRPAVYTLIYTVKDNSGNAAAIMARTVRVLDAVAPVLTLKGEQSVTINAVENYKDAGASARDNVDGDISKSIKTTGTVNANKPGVYTIIYSVKDKSGNAAVSVVRTVTVVDAVSPVITLKGEQTMTINVGEAYEDAGATARDNVDGNITKSITITGVVDPSRPAVYTLIYTVKDNSGNAAAIMARTVRVLDAVAPVLTLKGEQSVTINAVENYKDAGASARDNVDGDISKSIKTTGTVNANKPGVYTIIYSVKDKSGNAAVSVVRTVTVVDAVSPVITLKGEQTVTINAGENYTDAGATAHDVVDGDISKLIGITGLIDTGSPGVYTITFNVKDSSGNAATAVVRTIEVVKLAPRCSPFPRNRNSTITVTFVGQLQTADGVNAAWLTLDTESPAVLSTEKAAAFFRAVRN